MAGADAVEGAEGRTEVPSEARHRSPPGSSEQGMRIGGLPRNLGSLLIPHRKKRKKGRPQQEKSPGLDAERTSRQRRPRKSRRTRTTGVRTVVRAKRRKRSAAGQTAGDSASGEYR